LGCRREDGAVTITLSDGEILTVAAAAVGGDLPAAGEEIPAEVLARLRAASERKAVAQRLFALLDRRLYAVAALRRKLGEEGFSEPAVSDVLAEFAAKGLHSDRRFAAAYCRDALARRPVGRFYLLARLRERRVDRAAAESAVAEILTQAWERELALAAGRRRWRRVKDPRDRAAVAQVIRFLQSRGFSASLARKAAYETAPGREDEE